MPNYYNPYNFFPVGYANNMGYSGMQMPQMQPTVPQQSMVQQPTLKAMEWVEGEVGAKAFQMPPNWPANQPIPLWDSTDTIIWLKSWGPMGIPNPMQKLHYSMPEQQNQPLLTNGQSGAGEPQQTQNQVDMSNYVTKDDLNDLREEVRKLRQARMNQSGNNQPMTQNQNGSQNQNRGGMNNA